MWKYLMAILQTKNAHQSVCAFCQSAKLNVRQMYHSYDILANYIIPSVISQKKIMDQQWLLL